jgi:hypothetical protein
MKVIRIGGRKQWLAVLVLAGPTLAISLPGCASSTSNAGTSPSGQSASTMYGASGAEEAVRSFLDAAQALEYGQMRRLFGTQAGPAENEWGVQEVEQRMVVLAGMLLHSAYSLRPLELGYLREDQRGFVATIIGTRYGNANVPITVVLADGRWYVEQLGVDSLVGEG